jgi:hypothetical protein
MISLRHDKCHDFWTLFVFWKKLNHQGPLIFSKFGGWHHIGAYARVGWCMELRALVSPYVTQDEQSHACWRSCPCVVATSGTPRETLASPSAKCTRGRGKNTRGRLPWVQHSGKSLRGCLSWGRGLPRVPKIVHSGKPSPSVVLALGEDLPPSAPSTFFFFLENLFPECPFLGTRGRNKLDFLFKGSSPSAPS